MGRLNSNVVVSEVEMTQSIIDEAHHDPWGLWAIVGHGRHRFGLTGDDLQDYVRRTVVDVVKAGARPVVGDRAASSGWRLASEYGVDPQQVADALIAEWNQSGRDPDLDGVWFAFPAVYE